MEEAEAQILIQKYLNNSAEKKDVEKLATWLQREDNKETFTSIVQVNYLADYNLMKFEAEKAKNQLLLRIKAEKRKIRKQRMNSVIKYAAVFVLFLGLGYIFQNELNINRGQDKIIPANDAITLELEDGTLEILSTGSIKEVKGAEGNVVAVQKDDIISYKDEGTVKDLVYNTLRVPYGKRFNLELSDGTQVYLNAGSSIRYPVQFLTTGSRTVDVVGEAYFKVESDPARPFIVNAENLNVQVLGTEFNVAAYPEDTSTEVVLVEGKVALYARPKSIDKAVALSPGLKGAFNRLNEEIQTEEVNVNVYTAWRDGELVFRNLPFHSILKKLERHYHVQIINTNKKLDKEVFNASFDEEKIEKVLEHFDDIFNINYEIKDNTIIIK